MWVQYCAHALSTNALPSFILDEYMNFTPLSGFHILSHIMVTQFTSSPAGSCPPRPPFPPRRFFGSLLAPFAALFDPCEPAVFPELELELEPELPPPTHEAGGDRLFALSGCLLLGGLGFAFVGGGSEPSAIFGGHLVFTLSLLSSLDGGEVAFGGGGPAAAALETAPVSKCLRHSFSAGPIF